MRSPARCTLVLYVAVSLVAVAGPFLLLGQTRPRSSETTPPSVAQRILDYDTDVTIQTADIAASVETRFRVTGSGWCSVEIRAFHEGAKRDQWFGGGSLATGAWSPWEPVVDHQGPMTIRLANTITCREPGGAAYAQVRYWASTPEQLTVPTAERLRTPVERVEVGRMEPSGVGPWYFSFAVGGSDLEAPLVRVNRFLTEALCTTGREEYVEMAERMLQTGDDATREAIRFSLNTITECVGR